MAAPEEYPHLQQSNNDDGGASLIRSLVVILKRLFRETRISGASMAHRFGETTAENGGVTNPEVTLSSFVVVARWDGWLYLHFGAETRTR